METTMRYIWDILWDIFYDMIINYIIRCYDIEVAIIDRHTTAGMKIYKHLDIWI